jgi:hypothetical protein
MSTEPFSDASGLAANGFTLAIDHTADEFYQEDVTSGSPIPISSGAFTSANGFLSVSLNPYDGAVSSPPEAGNWLLEIPATMGFAYISAPNAQGLDGNVSGAQGQGDTSQNLVPFVSNATCPSVATAQSYEFLTFPSANSAQAWDFETDTAYGSVTLATLQDGAVVNLTGIQQFLLPDEDVKPGTAVSLNPGPGAISGSCGSSAGGDLISVSYVDIDGVSHYAEIDLASGFLLESNKGMGVENFGISNVLGAGDGAVGLLTPSSAVDEAGIVEDTYRGFVRVPDSYTTTSAFSGSGVGSNSCASFKSELKSLPTQPSATTIYGGEFAGNDPKTNAASNCDVAIDLGKQDSSVNGLFTAATLYFGSSFPLNNPSLTGAPGVAYSIPAIAIAGQIGGQHAVFVLAQDTVSGSGHAVAIYLLHSGS